MAENQGIWGIDIGQAGLKAIRLRYAESAGQVIATAFDYVPHPKILSQPDALPEELIPQALETFLSRNDVQGDRVAISVPGQTALARFIQLPPVESSKVSEIVKYEARQQIPFALEDVIWDYQTLGGGTEESGFMLEAEVGLFAMKRDQVMQQLRPFANAKVEVELIQISPLALYNYLTFDRLGIGPDDDAAGMDEYTIVLDMGADNTTLLVSNGEKIWIRNVPIGGNHFTRALTKEMKLTFAKAEHLKCNATKSPDPRAVFQALRPVFNDYVSEIQRSIGYFSSVNREAKITKVLGLGNGFKLAGLQKFLQQNLQYEVERVHSFQALVGDSVLNAPLFEEHILSFAVPYGLALQTMGLSKIHTTLLPPEIATARKIRRKKPWAVAAAAMLLVGSTVTAAGSAHVWDSVSPTRFKNATDKVKKFTNKVDGYNSKYQIAVGRHQSNQERGALLTRSLAQREYWLEVYKAINESLPRDVGEELDNTEIEKQNRIMLTSITAQRVSDLTEWFEPIPNQYKRRMLLEDQENPPTGEGYLFTLHGKHYHHDEKDAVNGRKFGYVKSTLLKSLQQWTVQNDEGSPAVPVRKLGITHATVVLDRTESKEIYPNGKDRPGADVLNASRGFNAGGINGRRRAKRRTKTRSGLSSNPGGGEGFAPGPGDFNQGILSAELSPQDESNLQKLVEEAKPIEVSETEFVLEFIWREIPKTERLKEQPKYEPKPKKASSKKK